MGTNILLGHPVASTTLISTVGFGGTFSSELPFELFSPFRGYCWGCSGGVSGAPWWGVAGNSLFDVGGQGSRGIRVEEQRHRGAQCALLDFG